MIDSNIHGVQFGLQPFFYYDLPMNVANRPILIQYMVQNGLGVVELHATWVEPRFNAPGVSPEQEACECFANGASPPPRLTTKACARDLTTPAFASSPTTSASTDSYTDVEIGAGETAQKFSAPRA